MDVERALAPLSVAEEARLLAGASYWVTADVAGAGAVAFADGPHGLRKQGKDADNLGLNQSEPATCFPAACATACSFDEDLLRAIGRALGEECRDQGVDVLLGPGLNVKRHPLGGRAFEYFSEDPLLSGRLGAAMIEGIQSQGIGACAKHFAANSQETARMTSDSVVDDRALREVYLRPFEIAVRRANPRTVMTAYNRLNGAYCSQNAELIDGVLRGEWDFAGATVTDWGALSESVPSVVAGLDVVMPGPREDHARTVAEAVARGELSREALDAAAQRVATLAARAAAGRKLPYTCDIEAHAALAARAAQESAVLLENDGTLPLSLHTRAAVIGAFAKQPRYQGAGSSRVNPVALDCAWDALAAAGLDVAYAAGYDAETGEATEEQLAEAAALASARGIAVVFAGLPASFESEGYDRESLAMPTGMQRLIERVCEANARTVVVLMGGGPMELPWIAGNAPRPAAVLLAYLPGCQGGRAIARLLTGQANPSGKLAETWPRTLADTALGDEFPSREREILYRESIYVGYRYYDAAGVDVAYPFGHGLSYTRFEYANPQITAADGALRVSFDVANVGECDGAEAAQVYVRAIDSVAFRPPQELAAFAKPRIRAGETARVEVLLDARAFAYWDTGAHAWRVDAGRYEIRVGASSRNIRLSCEIELDEDAPFPVVARACAKDSGGEGGEPAARAGDSPVVCASELAPYYQVAPHGFTDDSFRALYGRPLPEPVPERPFTIDSPVGSLRATAFGRIVHAVIAKIAGGVGVGDDTGAMLGKMLDDLPLRSFTMGGFSLPRVQGLVDLLNGRAIAGLRKLIGG